MKCLTLPILILVFYVLLVGCAPAYVYSIQLHETIEDTEFDGMYGQEGIHDGPETGIVLENNSDADITVRFEGNTPKTISVLSGGTSSVHLPPGSYRYIISSAGDTRSKAQSLSSSKVLKMERPIIALTGEKTVREKCRTTFDVFLEKKAVE